MTIGSYARELRAELSKWRAVRRAGGVRRATSESLRAILELDDEHAVTDARLAAVEATVAAESGALRAELAAALDRMEAAEAELQAVATRAVDVETRLRTLHVGFEEERHRVAAEIATRLGRPAILESVATVTAWVDQARLEHEPLISVILPTRRSRARWLDRAVESVRAQRYPHWELLVVVDGPEERDEIERALERFGDDRIRLIESTVGGGVSRARNVALANAHGELITYHDDDNTLGPSWLRAVAWAAERWPDAAVFYGARIVEDPREYVGSRSPDQPWLHLEPFDFRKLTFGNYLDQCVLAHRASLPGVHYDEELPGNVDWDVLLRLLRDQPPRMLPVVACHYATSATGRITGAPATIEAWTTVRERARAVRPLRVLSYSFHYPVVEMSYVGEDLRGLELAGAEIAFCSVEPLSSPQREDHVLYRDLEVAVRDFTPDVILVHWLTFAQREHARLESLGVPYAVRTHSFPTDLDPEAQRAMARSPGCVGVWARSGDEGEGVHVVPQLFPSGLTLPPRAADADLVCSLSAGLPKKEWDLLLEALGPLEGIDRRIVIGTTLEYEDLPGAVIKMAQRYPRPPLVQVNLTHEQVHQLLARAAVVVYTVEPDHAFVSPMSVIAGLAAGASVVVPDRPEARDLVGPEWFRGYRSADDIRRHVRQVLAGGPVVAMEQAANRRRGLELFCDPAHGAAFYDGLRRAVATRRVFPT